MGRIRDKRGQILGEGVLDIPKTLLIFVIAFFILGVSAISYDFYIDVRDIESQILTRNIINCIAPQGNFYLDSFKEMDKSLSDYCGFSGVDRASARIGIISLDGEELRYSNYGDFDYSEKIKSLFEDGDITERISKYEPGYFGDLVVVDIINGSKENEGFLSVEVYFENEF